MDPFDNMTTRDRSGSTFEVRLYNPSDLSALRLMYMSFSPRPASQGLPPEDADVCDKWVSHLLQTGKNTLARRDDRVIGHASLIPDPGGRACEFVIFVHQDSRNLGIGTELTRFTLEAARRLGFSATWLTVEASNHIAIRLYKHAGFTRCDADLTEWTMSTSLGQ
jgi:RimJ/RimL family protein N-acetyltransferase